MTEHTADYGAIRCPGCAHSCCPRKGLECGGESDVVRACEQREGDAVRPERTSNPEYVDRGAWFVDDGTGVEFFDEWDAAQRYADRCNEDDKNSAGEAR